MFRRRFDEMVAASDGDTYTRFKPGPRGYSESQLMKRRLSRLVRTFFLPIVVLVLVYAFAHYQHQNSVREQQLRDFYYAEYDYDAQYLAYQAEQRPMSLYGAILQPELSVDASHMSFVPSAEAVAFNQGYPQPAAVAQPVQPVVAQPVAPVAPVQPVAAVAPQPVAPVAPVAPVQPVAASAPAAPVAAQPVAPAAPAAPVQPVVEQPPAPTEPPGPTEPPKAMFAGGELKEHEMMLIEDAKVEVKKKVVLPPVKKKMTETKEYVGNVTWPTIEELEVPAEIKAQYEDWYKIGMNRQRQKAHGSEIPAVRYPDLIITGAKKCGTTALKIFMNYHTWFQDTPGERHFFNRPTNWAKGYQWYHDEMPLTFKNEICYEKTPDYFDRPFIPERMSKLDNAKDIKFVHVLCDPVRRSFSHFLHMFTVQQVGQWGVGGPQPGFEFLQENFADITKEEAFEKTVELAFENLLGKDKDIDLMSDDEIRAAVADYFTRWDLKPGSPGRVFPLRIPDAVLTGSLYSTHINTYLHYFTQEQMLYLDATELIENPGMSLRRVADFAGVPQLITEENFYFDDEKGYFCMKPPVESARESFCLGSSKGRSKDKSLPTELKRRIRKFFNPFVKDLETKFTGDNYDHWDW